MGHSVCKNVHVFLILEHMVGGLDPSQNGT